jgi:hypothetical protein
MASVRYLSVGELPLETPHLLVECVPGTKGAHLVRHADGITETIALQALALMLPVFVERAEEEGIRVVYVRGAATPRRFESAQQSESSRA